MAVNLVPCVPKALGLDGTVNDPFRYYMFMFDCVRQCAYDVNVGHGTTSPSLEAASSAHSRLQPSSNAPGVQPGRMGWGTACCKSQAR
jgi:hypothetical protein